jgi:hypothetical protein
LALVGRGEPVIFTKFTEGTGLDAGRGLHQELVNDNYSCSSRHRRCCKAIRSEHRYFEVGQHLRIGFEYAFRVRH